MNNVYGHEGYYPFIWVRLLAYPWYNHFSQGRRRSVYHFGGGERSIV